MQIGFSIVGPLFMAMLFVPNIFWGKRPPEGYEDLSKQENPKLLGFERVGQVAATVSAVIFVSPHGFDFPWLLWLIACFVVMVLYEVAWIRYFKNDRQLLMMYLPLGFIPVPLASLPVVALVLLGVWCLSLVTVAAAVILGIGHIGIHLGHLKSLSL